MSSPVERLEPFPEPGYMSSLAQQRSSEEDATLTGYSSQQHKNSDEIVAPHNANRVRLQVETNYTRDDSLSYVKSPSQTREEAFRLEDDLRVLQAEREVERAEEKKAQQDLDSPKHDYDRRVPADPAFDAATNPLHESTVKYTPPPNPSTRVSRFFKKVHRSNVLIRYFTYIVPVVLILLIPLLVGALLPIADHANVGGVELLWFCIWLEIVWLTLWAGRLLAKALPWPCGVVASLFTNSSNKWRDMAKQLELSATLFFWWLGILVSFEPTMRNHHLNGNTATKPWENTMNKVLIAFFVATILNFIEKIIIQLIAIAFHQRTYADRIETNKFQIGSLTKLYTFSKMKLKVEDSDFEPQSGPASGARTPGQYLEKAQKGTKHAFHRFGDVAGKIAGDFTGKAVKGSNHPDQVVLSLLDTTSGSQVLARRLYRTFAGEETETVHPEALKLAFDDEEECDTAFTMFDKDLNGDISMEEFEAVCVEIGRERKAITASLKDLDSVVGKFDSVLTFIAMVISIVVLIALISASAFAGISTAGTTFLGLSWLLQSTAQEFLQSLIFVFIKHPFDVGDRITIYGNTGATLKGDDYFVKEISLLFTEFKKMEGHIVQAPNSYLNTLFILNQRRSGRLAEAVPMTFKFGTTLEQIDGLRIKLLDFVKAEKREFQGQILTELREIVEAHAITVNVVFFYKSNWQNEGLRIQRRNKFICAMMVAIDELGIEGPRMRYPGQRETFPLYMQNIPFASADSGRGGHPDNPSGLPSIANTTNHYENEHENQAPLTPVLEETSKDTSPTLPTLERFPSARRDSNSASDAHSRAGSVPHIVAPSASRIREPTLPHRPRGESILGRPTTRLDPLIERPRIETIAEMAKRYDFSLGLEGMTAADTAGDVYEARRRTHQRIPANLASSSVSRTRAEDSTERHRRGSRASATASTAADGDRVGFGRTTSRSQTFGATGGAGPPGVGGVGGMLQRVGTDISHLASSGRVGPRSGSIGSLHKNRFFRNRRSTETEGDRRLEAGLGRIAPDGGAAAGIAENGGIVLGSIDPRTGFTSPLAVRGSLEGRPPWMPPPFDPAVMAEHVRSGDGVDVAEPWSAVDRGGGGAGGGGGLEVRGGRRLQRIVSPLTRVTSRSSAEGQEGVVQIGGVDAMESLQEKERDYGT